MKLKERIRAILIDLINIDFFQKSPLMLQKKGDPTLSFDQYKWASLDCLFIFPIVMSLLIIPLAYGKSACSFIKEYWLASLPKGFAWNKYIPIVIAVYYCCVLVHIMITVFFIEKIRIKVDPIKKLLTLILPVYLIVCWGNPINLSIKNKTVFLIFIILILIANWLISEIFEYINMRAKGKWYVIKPWRYGSDFSDLLYYLVYGVLTLIAILLCLYIDNQFSNTISVFVAILLIRISVLLGFSRKGVNNLVACEIVIMTVDMREYKLIDLEMCVCVLLSLYFTEQLQIWINRFIKRTTDQEQKKYISNIEKKVLSGYGMLGVIVFIVITLLEHGL